MRSTRITLTQFGLVLFVTRHVIGVLKTQLLINVLHVRMAYSKAAIAPLSAV